MSKEEANKALKYNLNLVWFDLKKKKRILDNTIYNKLYSDYTTVYPMLCVMDNQQHKYSNVKIYYNTIYICVNLKVNNEIKERER